MSSPFKDYGLSRKSLGQYIYSPEVFENDLRFAELLFDSGDTATSLATLTKLSEDVLQYPEVDPLIRISIFESKAIALAASGKDAEALSTLQKIKSHPLMRIGLNASRDIDIDEDVASILLHSDRIEDSLVAQSSVYLRRQTRFPKEPHKFDRSLWQLGVLYLVNHRFDTAEAILRNLEQNLISRDGWHSKLLYWQTLGRLASITAKRGDLIAAVEMRRRVYEGEREILGESSPDTIVEYVNLANSLVQIGNELIGCPMLAKSLEDQTRQTASDLWNSEYTRISLGECLLRNNDLASTNRAKDLFRDAFSRLSLGGREFGADALSALAGMAKADKLAGRQVESKAELMSLVRRSEALRVAQLRGLAPRDFASLAWMEGITISGDQMLGYRELALLHAQDAELEGALRVSELARDRTLGDQFSEQQWLRDGASDVARSELDPLQEQIQDFDERLAVTPDLMERVRLESERTVLVAQRGQLERRLRGARIADEASPPTLDVLREHLDARTALVSVTHSGPTWWALVIRRDTPARFVPFDDPDLGRNASAWVRRLRGEPVRAWSLANGGLAVDDLRPAGASGGYLSTAQLAGRLGHALLGPLAVAAGDARHLVFVGDDELAGIPLQALPLDAGLAIDRYDISYAPSLSTYARWQSARGTHHPRDLLALGAIDYPRRGGPGGDDLATLGLEFAADHPLAHTGEEITAIGALFPKARSRLLIGAAARKSELRAASRSGELAGYRYVHMATHAWVDPERPEASAVVLASDGSEPPLQVVMTAAELAGLRMKADLIVLSACDTGAGHYEHGRGLLGLAYAALAAGNRAAVLSLWPIADDSTVPFMVQFYGRLVAGGDPVAALAATQRAFRASADPKLADPAAWAPFVLYGGY